jgi:cyclic pyranopterin phosphate synthase
MVDVGDKAPTDRRAVAEGHITLSREAFDSVMSGDVPKGDVLAVARVAGIQGAKRTAELVPLCHPIPLTGVTVTLTPDPATQTFTCLAEVRTHGRTGVEMEAMAAVSAALLTVYDMVKALDRAPAIEGIRLLEKRGGRSGTWIRES